MLLLLPSGMICKPTTPPACRAKVSMAGTAAHPGTIMRNHPHDLKSSCNLSAIRVTGKPQLAMGFPSRQHVKWRLIP